MEVVLSSKCERLIHDRVASGEYSSASDVIEEALRLLLAEEEYERKLEALRREIQIGIDQLDRGEYSSAEEVLARLRARRGRHEEHEEVDDDETRLVALRNAVDIGIAEIERGELIPGPLAVEQARAEFRRITERAD